MHWSKIPAFPMLRDIFGIDFKPDFLVLNEKEVAKTESLFEGRVMKTRRTTSLTALLCM